MTCVGWYWLGVLSGWTFAYVGHRLSLGLIKKRVRRQCLGCQGVVTNHTCVASEEVF